MCTLTLAWRAFPDAPLVVAANRDEAVDRPSVPPAVISSDPTVFAPLDELAGGTWMGVNERGVFVGITNRWVEGLSAERSRGLLVRDCLQAESAAEAARVVERAVQRDQYDGFNLVVADAGPEWGTRAGDGTVDAAERSDGDDPSSAVLLEWDGTLRARNLKPGVHVVVNVGADGAFFEPARRPELGHQQAQNASLLREHLRPEPGESGAEWVGRARDAVGDHEFGVCVHEGEYGTVSSALVTLAGDGSMRYEHAGGPPCETPFELVHEGPLGGELASDDGGSRDGERGEDSL